MKIIKNTMLIVGLVALFVSYGNAHTSAIPTLQKSASQLQFNIKKGLKTAEIIKAIGIPNVITKAEDGKVSWAYDNLKTYTKEKLVTLVLNFDNKKKLQSFSYMYTSF